MKTKIFHLFLKKGKYNPESFRDYMKTIKLDTYTQIKKSECDLSDRNKYLIHYRKLYINVRHGMEIVKVHTVIPFKRRKWLENL